MTMSPVMTPDTSKTTIRGSAISHADLRLPGPEEFRLVTLMTLPPRPPMASLPKPSAPGKAGKALADDEIIKTKKSGKISGKK
jgi:hypothetical protein